MVDRWGAIIRAEASDLEDWVDTLKPPFDPWVEVHAPDHVLCSASFEGTASADEVRQSALSYIGLLNGAMAVINQSRPVQFAGVARITPNGQVHRTMFAEVGEEIKIKGRAAVFVLGPDGRPQPITRRKSQVQVWADLAQANELLEDALIYFGRAATARAGDDHPDWFDIYKALECLIIRFGPTETEFFKLEWVPSNTRNLKQTANWARHARRKYDPPKNPVTIKEARDLLALLICTAFEKVANSK
jgi:hypothetical protein